MACVAKDYCINMNGIAMVYRRFKVLCYTVKGIMFHREKSPLAHPFLYIAYQSFMPLDCVYVNNGQALFLHRKQYKNITLIDADLDFL